MNTQDNPDIDYEDMDDLQLSDHIEWSEISDNEICVDDLKEESDDYDTEYTGLNFDQ